VKRLHHIACYVNADEYAHLKEQAVKRHLSLSTYVKGCLLGQHEPLPFTKETKAGKSDVEILLRQSERRIAELTRAKTGEVLDQVAVLAAMLDRFALTMLIHTSEIPQEQRKPAAASGERRHQNWRRAVNNIVKDMALSEASAVNGAVGSLPNAEDSHELGA
jgi:hypothetical protein